MKRTTVAFGGLLAGVMLVAGSAVASANMAWCLSDPPIQVVTPGGHILVVNNLVYLPPNAMHLKDQITDDATAQPDGHGGTLLTVHVHVPARAHVVSSENRYGLSDQGDGDTVVTLLLDVPTS
jgi:hypothetical protein